MLIEDPENCAVFLDLDGTLIDIASTPDLVQIPPDLVPLLAQVSAGLKGALAIVTGRSVAEINRFLDPLQLVTAGIHGAQLRTEANGEVLLTVDPIDPVVSAAVHSLTDLAPGIVIEPKVYSIAVHYRLALLPSSSSNKPCRPSWPTALTISSCARAAASSRLSLSMCRKGPRSMPCWPCRHFEGAARS